MKKLLASLVVFSFLLVGCGGSSSEEFEVALVTDAGDINDKSFNQSAWEAVEQYQKDHDATIMGQKLLFVQVLNSVMQLVNYKINTKMSNLS